MALFLNSCKNDLEEKIKLNDELVEFQGELIKLPKNVNSIDLSNFLNFHIDFSKIKNAKESSLQNRIPSEELYKIIGKLVKKYPNFTKESFSENDFQIFKAYFPKLKGLSEANLKKDIIFDLYEVIISKELKEEIKVYLNKNKSSKKLYDFDGSNPTEDIVATNHPGSAYQIKNNTKPNVQNHYGNHNDGTITNAKLHFSLSAGCVKEIAHLTGNKWKALDRGKQFATAHEYDTNNITSAGPTLGHVAVAEVRDLSIFNYIDLRNNLTGRTYMYNTIGQTWLGNANNIPSYANIFSAADNCSTQGNISISQTLNIGGSTLTYDQLSHYLFAYNYHSPSQNILVHLD